MANDIPNIDQNIVGRIEKQNDNDLTKKYNLSGNILVVIYAATPVFDNPFLLTCHGRFLTILVAAVSSSTSRCQLPINAW